ncbi:MAG: STAS domain-containing protein [Pseudomonadota bacterium]
MISFQESRTGVFQIDLEGPRLDASLADAIKARMKEMVDQGAHRLELDFTNVQFMDSSGLGALVGALKLMGPGGQVEIVNPSATIMKVLKLTRMTKVFEIREGHAG